jgi:hypothetical protein
MAKGLLSYWVKGKKFGLTQVFAVANQADRLALVGHQVMAGNMTFLSGSKTVACVANLAAEVAAGDWIWLAADTRTFRAQVASVAAGGLSLQLVSDYLGAGGTGVGWVSHTGCNEGDIAIQADNSRKYIHNNTFSQPPANGDWTVISSEAAADIVFTPAGAIAAATVQLALQELDTEKLALAGGTMTGDIDMGATFDIVNGGALSFLTAQVAADIQIGGGAVVENFEIYTVPVTPTNPIAGRTVDVLAGVACAGVTVADDRVIAAYCAALEAGLVAADVFVDADDTLTVRISNPTGVGVATAPHNWTVVTVRATT